MALVCDLVHQLALRVDGDDALVGFADAGEQQVDLSLERGDLAAMFGDVRQVGLAARADLVHVLDFGLHRVDQRFAAGDGGDALVEFGDRSA